MTPSQHQFAKAIEKLNTPQKEAVERIDGPVMVLAGPGTGKTDIKSNAFQYIYAIQAQPKQAFQLNLVQK